MWMRNMLEWEDLSENAKSTAKGMIEYCIECGYRMGMDEGFTKHDRKRSFRVQLEKFCGMEKS